MHTEDNMNKKTDEALCELNQELLSLRHSKEYFWGLKLAKFIYAVKHFRPYALYMGFKHSRVNRKIKKYDCKNENFITYDSSVPTKGRVAVYTCITGNYDRPIEPIFVPDNLDFFIVTDMKISRESAWKKIDIHSIEATVHLDNTRKARYIKTHPHVLFPQYEYSIWIDSNFKAVANLSKFIKYIGKGVPFASNWHPHRNCVYTEARACILAEKDNKDILERQMEKYRDEGMPRAFGLIETNLIVRKHMDEKCVQLMEDWWNEMTVWSKRDQLSLPYVIWKNGYTMRDMGFICTEIRRNPNVQVVLHTSKYNSPVE